MERGQQIGSVIAMKNAVSPAACGVDLGCGMAAVKTSLTVDRIERKLKQLRTDIETAIPVGGTSHKESVTSNRSVVGEQIYHEAITLFEEFKNLNKNVQSLSSRAMVQLGTLGQGNHFIEVLRDTEDNVWLMLHSGSRNIGKELAEIHIAIARKLAHNQELPDKDLSVFLAGTSEMERYRADLTWSQQYAALNRKVMLHLFKQVFLDYWPGTKFTDEVHCHHNYISEEKHFGEDVFVTRKGAIYAGAGIYGIIPGSMATQSYIVRGLGNEESFCSAPHGAGRKMSRGNAKRKFNREDVIKQTEGIECRKDSGIADELPGAYKNITKVMEYSNDLVEIVAELSPLICVKG